MVHHQLSRQHPVHLQAIVIANRNWRLIQLPLYFSSLSVIINENCHAHIIFSLLHVLFFSPFFLWKRICVITINKNKYVLLANKWTQKRCMSVESSLNWVLITEIIISLIELHVADHRLSQLHSTTRASQPKLILCSNTIIERSHSTPGAFWSPAIRSPHGTLLESRLVLISDLPKDRQREWQRFALVDNPCE